MKFDNGVIQSVTNNTWQKKKKKIRKGAGSPLFIGATTTHLNEVHLELEHDWYSSRRTSYVEAILHMLAELSPTILMFGLCRCSPIYLFI